MKKAGDPQESMSGGKTYLKSIGPSWIGASFADSDLPSRAELKHCSCPGAKVGAFRLRYMLGYKRFGYRPEGASQAVKPQGGIPGETTQGDHQCGQQRSDTYLHRYSKCDADIIRRS